MIGRKRFGIYFLFSGGIVTALYFKTEQPIVVDSNLVNELSGYGITEINGLVPEQLFGWGSLGTARGIIMMVVGGFFVGFGTRYAGGCTSGHAIMGLSNLQLPSLIATISFFHLFYRFKH
jgi:uncharacterized membrane protein YedE/YeeE